MSSENQCRRGCLHTLFCWFLGLLRALHLISKHFYRKHCSCDLKLAAISFNHDTNGLTGDAINVRKNFTTTVAPPEWTPAVTSAADSPAAYAIAETQGHKITIKAKFTISPWGATQAEIKADGGGVLGGLDPQIVNFANGVSVPEFVSFELGHHTIGNDGIDVAADRHGSSCRQLATAFTSFSKSRNCHGNSSRFRMTRIPGLKLWITPARGPPAKRPATTRLRRSLKPLMRTSDLFMTMRAGLRITRAAFLPSSS